MYANGIHKKAAKVSSIFTALGWAILAVGGLATVALIMDGTGESVALAIAVAVGTAIYWAAISLGSIVAGYISVRLQEPAAAPMWAAPPVWPAYPANESHEHVGTPSI